MKSTTLIFCCCSVFLVACDSGDEKGMLDKADLLVNDVVNDVSDAASDIGEKAGDSINNAAESAIGSAKKSAKNVVERAQEKTTAVADSAKDSVSKIVDTAKNTGVGVVQSVTDKADAVIVTAPAVAAVDNKATDNKEGETIFKDSCNACHGAGIAGSPKLGDKTAWTARIAQGKTVLVEHAIKGFQGKDGFYMPPKGGAMHLSDEQIEMVVDFMISRAQ